jgi:hypothetical protein
MMTNEKNLIMVKVQQMMDMGQKLIDLGKEVKSMMNSLPEEEASLFDEIPGIPVEIDNVDLFNEIEAKQPEPAQAPRKRTVHKDGSMTASSMAYHISKQTGTKVTKEQVVEIGNKCGAKAVYNEVQHASRYTPESVAMITQMFSTFNRYNRF